MYMRAHIVLDNELVKDIDSLVGKRKRSLFIAEAVSDKLRRVKLLTAVKETVGILSDKDHPEWKTSKDISDWVRESRKRDGHRLEGLNFD
jgi:metal-responsive CopG/Arc/MetJ family transcriptional regulator